ncbi:MAG: CBS domain-containing protein [Methanocellales archaeon]|nr:CBS domain-containing protein [Methanocellales archaeon]
MKEGKHIKVQDMMSKYPISIKENEFMTKARQLMRLYHFRSMPVVDDENRVTGVITRQDVLKISSTKSNITVKGFAREYPTIIPGMSGLEATRVLLASKLECVPVVNSVHDREIVGVLSITDIFKNLDVDSIPARTVSEVMSTDVKVCSPKDPISKCWANMDEYDYSGFPVVKGKKLIGIITRHDIIKAGYARTSRGGKSNRSTTIEKVMRTSVHSTHPETTLKEAIELMLEHDIGRLPVVNDGELVGIIDRYDLISGMHFKLMKRHHSSIKKGARLADESSGAVLDRGPVEFKSRIPSRPGDIMTIASREVVTVPPTMTIMDAVKTMMTYGFRRIPVAEAGTNRLVGIFTSTDLLDFMGGGERYKIIIKKYDGNFLAAINGSVREVMQCEVVTLKESQSLKDALAMMLQKNIGGMPIVTEDKRIIGIISEQDFVELIAGIKTGKTVRDHMSERVITILPDMSIEEATKTMRNNGLRRLPVVKDGILLGMASSRDIVRYIGGGEIFNQLTTGDIHEALGPPIKTIMRSTTITIEPDVDLGKAAEVMLKGHVGSLPVISEGALAGFFTERDLLQACPVS